MTDREDNALAPPPPRVLGRALLREAALRGGVMLRSGVYGSIVSGSFLVASIFLQAATHAAVMWFVAACLGMMFLATTLIAFVGARRTARARAVYRDGVAVLGEVISVTDNTDAAEYHWEIRYSYVPQGGAQKLPGFMRWPHGQPPNTQRGAEIVVLHDVQRPTESVIWTRFDDGDDAT